MNAPHPIRNLTSRLTAKYQATIPKEIREALGLKTGDLVRFTLDADGSALVERAGDDEQFERRRAELSTGIGKARERFAKESVLPPGMTSKEWYDLMRGPAAEV